MPHSVQHEFNEVKDSGEREEFGTGAVRDSQGDKGRYDLVLSLTHMIYRLARHFENGAVKYGDDNWKKGIPLRRYLDSAFRHLTKYAAGETDEDHLSAAIWNLMCHGETANMIERGLLPIDLDDMPKYEVKFDGMKHEKNKIPYQQAIDNGVISLNDVNSGGLCHCSRCEARWKLH